MLDGGCATRTATSDNHAVIEAETQHVSIDALVGRAHEAEIGFPASEGWVVQGFDVTTKSLTILNVEVLDARTDCSLLSSGLICISNEPALLFLAYRILGGASETVHAEVALASSQRGALIEHARTSLSTTSLPSNSAVRCGWRDDAVENDVMPNTSVTLGETEIIDVVSWNGRFSTDTAVTYEPKFAGAFFVDRIDAATATRISGSIRQWPEPVWFVSVRCEQVK